jgi:hypothetical protein
MAPGEMATFTEVVPPDAPAASAAWHYVVVAVADRVRRGAPSAVVTVPLGRILAPPRDLELSYDEQSLSLAWTLGEPGLAAEVLAAPAGGDVTVLTPTPIDTGRYQEPTVFGEPRCLTARAVFVSGGAVVESPAAAPVCETPVDRFPPPRPTSLAAVPAAGGVSLVWTGVDAADLAGYLVLRGGGSGETLAPLVAAPVTGTSYRDTDVRPGGTYVYAVVAVDRSTPPNRSPESNREAVIAR